MMNYLNVYYWTVEHVPKPKQGPFIGFGKTLVKDTTLINSVIVDEVSRENCMITICLLRDNFSVVTLKANISRY